MSVIDDIEKTSIAFVFLFIIFRLLLEIHYSATSADLFSLRGDYLLSLTISMNEIISASIRFCILSTRITR